MDNRDVKLIVKKADIIGGNNTWFMKLFMFGCALFCGIIHTAIIYNIDNDNIGSVINIFPPYYLMSLAVNTYGGNKLLSVIPIKSSEANRVRFKQTVVACMVWSSIVILHNVSYMFNDRLYEVRGIFGLCLVATAIYYVMSYIGRYVSDKKWMLVAPSIFMIVFTLLYLVLLFLEMADKSIAILRGITVVFGVFSGYVAIVISLVVSCGIIAHFYLVQYKKERTWEI